MGCYARATPKFSVVDLSRWSRETTVKKSMLLEEALNRAAEGYLVTRSRNWFRRLQGDGRSSIVDAL